MNLAVAFRLFLINCEICGALSVQSQSCDLRQGLVANVVGGDKAAKNEWPWLVAFDKIPEEKFFCAGSLVSFKHVLLNKSK